MRLFPIILGIIAVAFINTLSFYRNGFPILSSLGSLALTMLLLLILITIISILNKYEFWEKGKKLFLKNKILPEINEDAEESASLSCGPKGDLDLIDIQKENFSESHTASVRPEKRVYGALYIISFLGIAFWHISRIFRVMPFSYVEHYRRNIVDAVLLLVIPCISALYLKIRKDGSCPTDRISRDILMLFSYTSCIYAAVIAAASVLNINILVVLQWVYYAVSMYLVASLAVNIVLSMLQGDILGFNYTLFPKISRTKDALDKSVEKPEAQWKVSLKSLYTIKYTLTILPALVLALIAVLFLSTALFVVQPHQQAAVYRFGKLDRSSIKSEGLHFKFPWPIDRTEIYDVHRVASMQIGYQSSGRMNYLWTQMHDGGEYMLLLGNGNEIAAVNLKLMYVISDLYAYISTCANPEAVLNAAAYNALMSRTINTTLDSFLSVDRNSLSVSVLDELSEFCATENLGFSVVQVIVESIHPPVDLADVYQRVVSASVDKTTVITRAQAYAEAKIIQAQRQSKAAIDQARAMQHSRISDAQKEAVVFYAAMEAYRISGGSFQLTKYLDVHEKIISGNKVYVFSPRMENSISKFIIGRVNTINLSGVNEGGGNE